ncbi:MAG: hypothetical protein MUF54_23440, partial [Polyangiaceae bacterium]|nr:hypothetical protein [Polyangiaceae bacterium]
GDCGCNVVFIEQNLALQVVQLGEVTVEQADTPDTCAHDRLGDVPAEGTASDHEHCTIEKALLSFDTQLAQHDLP